MISVKFFVYSVSSANLTISLQNVFNEVLKWALLRINGIDFLGGFTAFIHTKYLLADIRTI